MLKTIEGATVRKPDGTIGTIADIYYDDNLDSEIIILSDGSSFFNNDKCELTIISNSRLAM